MRCPHVAVFFLVVIASTLVACGLSFFGKDAYGTDVIRQSLNVSIPEGTAADARLPAVVFIHGGYWGSGDLLNMSDHVQAAVSNGLVGVTINYRYATATSPWPAQIQDVKCAIRFVKANAARFHIDPARIAVAGFSVGGHLALMTAFSQGVTTLEKCDYGSDQPDPARDSSVITVVSQSGVSNLESALSESGQVSGALQFSIQTLIGTVADKTTALRVASPTCYVDQLPECLNGAPLVPVLQIHGQNDDVIMPIQPQQLHQRLAARGYPQPRYVLFCNQKHPWKANKPRMLDITMAFLREQLRGEAVAPEMFEDVGC